MLFSFPLVLNDSVFVVSHPAQPGIVNCCVVVVRYFGGILLGTGGLVRAYTQGCKIALQAASVVRMELSVLRQCRVSYPAWNQIQYTLQNLPVILEGIEYSDSVSFRICTRSKDMAEIVQTLNNLTDGKAAWTDQEEKYMPWTI